MEDPVLDITGQEHLTLLASEQEDTLRVNGLELDLNVQPVLHSLVLQVEVVNQVRVTKKS